MVCASPKWGQVNSTASWIWCIAHCHQFHEIHCSSIAFTPFDALLKGHLKSTDPALNDAVHKKDSLSFSTQAFTTLTRRNFLAREAQHVCRSESEGLESAGVDTLRHNPYKTSYCSIYQGTYPCATNSNISLIITLDIKSYLCRHVILPSTDQVSSRK